MFLPLYMGFAKLTVPKERVLSLSTSTKCYAFVAGMFGFYLAPFASLHALSHIGAGIERILLYCFPAIVILLQSIIDRRLPPISYIFVFLLMQYGIVLTVKSLHVFSGGIEGALWALGGAFLFSVYVTFNHALVKRTGSTLFILYALYGATTAVTVHFLILEPFSVLQLSDKGMLYVAIFALLCTFIPGYLFSEGVKRIGSSRASLISMACPAITVVFAYVFLHEILQPKQLIGGLIVLAAIMFLESGIVLKRRLSVPQ